MGCLTGKQRTAQTAVVREKLYVTVNSPISYALHVGEAYDGRDAELTLRKHKHLLLNTSPCDRSITLPNSFDRTFECVAVYCDFNSPESADSPRNDLLPVGER